MWCLWCGLWCGLWSVVWCCWWSWCVFGVCVWCVPRRVLACPRGGSPKKPLDLTHFKFENKSNTACSRFHELFALPDENCSTPASMKKHTKNQPLDGSICLSRQETEFKRTICASISLRASTRNSPALLTLRSPSFGSSHLCPYSNHFQDHEKYTYMFLSRIIKDTATFKMKLSYDCAACPCAVLCPCCVSGLV